MSRNILDAAYTISFHLNELLDETETEAINKELDELLEKTLAGENVKTQIREVLKRNEKTRQWMHEFLNPSDDSRFSSEFYQPLPGEGKPVAGIEKYACPVEGCWRRWYRQKSGQKIPQCPKHQVTLILEQSKEENQ